MSALIGCDTVSYRSGIGKATTLNVLMGGHHLIELCQHGADGHRLISDATSFVAACYGSRTAHPRLVRRTDDTRFRLLMHNIIVTDSGVGVGHILHERVTSDAKTKTQ